MANKNTRSLSSRKGINKNLFEEISLQTKKENTTDNLKKVASSFLVNDSVVAGTASFYDFTKTKNRKQKVFVCNGTACMCANTQDSLKESLEKHFKKEEIGHASCLGHCHTNAAFLYNEKTYSAKNEEEIIAIIADKPLKNSFNEYLVACNTQPILTENIDKINDYFTLATSIKNNPENVIQQLKQANLRGRGGAGFPFWFKIDAVAKEKNETKYIVCNADEGDPGAFSDMYLLEKQTFKVLFGMYVSGLTVGAKSGILYVRKEYPDSLRIVNESIVYLKSNKLTPNFEWKVIQGQGSYICGEETALLSSIEGLRPEVRVRPPYPAQYGLYGKPTLLSNVETFANLHFILKNSGSKFAAIGTKLSTGTKLVSLDSFFNQPGLFEIEMGTPILEIIEKYGKGFKNPIKAIQIGGPLGGIVPIDKLKDLTLDFESFTNNGFLLGHASFVCIPDDFPIIKYMEHLMKFIADESCGKCYPCRIGSFRGFEMLNKASTTDYKIDKKLFDDLLETLELGSLCALGGGLPLPIKNILEYFHEEVKTYFK